MESSGMIPFLNIILLTSLNPVKKLVSLNTYISQNAQKYCYQYHIPSIELMPNIVCLDKIEKNREAFFEYLDSIGVGYTFDGYYYYFFKKK